MFESLMIQLEVENHEQLAQVVKKDGKKNTEVSINIDGEHVLLHDDEVFKKHIMNNFKTISRNL